MTICFALLLTAAVVSASSSAPTLSFGEPNRSISGEIVVPVLLDVAGAADVAAWSISIRADESMIGGVTVQGARDVPPSFETTARDKSTVTYLAWWQQNAADGVIHIADIHLAPDVAPGAEGRIDFDRGLTTLSDAGGLHARSAANGELQFASQGRRRARR